MAIGDGPLLWDLDPAPYGNGLLATVGAGQWANGYWSGQASLNVASSRFADTGSTWCDAYTLFSFLLEDGLDFIVYDVRNSSTGSRAFFHFLGAPASNPSGYVVSWLHNGTILLERLDAGTFTTLITSSPTTYDTSGGTQLDLGVRAAANGDLELLVRSGGGSWTSVGTANDTTYTSGACALEMNGATTQSVRGFEVYAQGALTRPMVIPGVPTYVTTQTSTPAFTGLSPVTDDVIVIQAMANVSRAIATPGGYAELGSPLNNANLSAEWFWKRAGASESAPAVDFGAAGSTSDVHATQAFVVRGAKTSGDPFDTTANAGSPTSSTTPAGSALTISDERRVVVWAAIDDDNAWSSGFPPSGWRRVTFSTTTTGGDANFTAIERAASANTAAPTVGTMSASDYWRTLTVAFAPAAVDSTPPVVTVTAGPTPARISAVTGFDEADFTFQVDEACQAWEVRAVGDPSDPRDTGDPLVLSGGALAASIPVPTTVTFDDLDAAGVAGSDGVKVLKVYAEDIAGNWS